MEILGAIAAAVLAFINSIFGVKSLPAKVPATEVSQPAKNTSVTGVVSKVANVTDDYTHYMMVEGKMVKLNSYTVKLDQYVGQKVTVTGQYSGNTLFADKAEVAQ